MYRSKLILALFALCSALRLSATVTVTETTPLVTQMVPCEPSTFTVQVNNTTSFASTDSLFLEVVLPAGIVTGGTWGCSNSGVTVVTDYSNPGMPTYTLKNMSGTSFTFWYTAVPGCDLFNPTTTSGLTNLNKPKFNNVPLATFFSSPYSVASAWLVYSAAGSVNINYTLAHFNVPFQRRIRFVNTGSVPFNGEFEFRDTSQYILGVSAMQFNSITVVHPAGVTLMSSSLSDTAVSYRGQINSLASGDSIVIVETLTQIRCPGSFNNTLTHFSLSYGCDNDTLCNNTGWTQTTSAFDPADHPTMHYTCMNVEKSCPADPDTMLFRIRNIGGGFADTLFFNVNRGDPVRNLSWFDTAEVQVFHRVGMVETPIPFVARSRTVNNAAISPHTTASWVIATTVPIAPGDSVFLRFIERKVCLDTSDYVFNDVYYQHWIHAAARLGHPCFPTNWASWDGNKSAWGYPVQQYAFQQLFLNMTGIMLDGQEEWFEINNVTPLNVNNTHGYFPNEITLDSNVVEFQVELELETGLGLLPDSIYLISTLLGVDTIWYPVQIDYTIGNGVNIGTGDRALAHFRFPAWFWDRNTGGVFRTYGAHFWRSPEWNQFLNNFRVAFKLKAYCQYAPPNSNADIKERTYFVYDVNCGPECKIPLSETGDDVNINCPGCRLPGWNLSRFDLRRTNLHFADDDNNNYPDAVVPAPANPALAQMQRVMIGDTLEGDIAAFTSDGEGNPILFNSIGFRYLYAELRMVSPFLDHLSFLGATGVYSIGTNNYPFTVPASAGVFGSGQFRINLDSTSLVSYGVPSSVVLATNNNHAIEITPRWRVEDNLTTGSGGDPWFSVEDINAWLYMSGVPITPSLVDANLLVEYIRDSLTGPQRANYLYWCTGWQGRIAGIGMDFLYDSYTHDYDGIWGVTGRDWCSKKVRMHLVTDLGEAHSGGFWGHDESNQVALNAFSFEFRELARLDSLQFQFPDEYELAAVQFWFSNPMLDTTANLTRYNCRPDWYTPYTYPIGDTVQVNDTTIRIFPSQVYQALTQPPANCGQNNPAVGDENKRVFMNAVLRMRDYQNTPTTFSLAGNYPLTSWISEFPLRPSGDTVITQLMDVSDVFNRPEPDLVTQVLPVTQTTSDNTLSWTVTLSVAPPPGSPWIRLYMDATAPNVFLTAMSPSGNINITNLVNNANMLNVAVVDTVPDSLPLFGIGGVGATLLNYTLNATYDCSDTLSDDSLLIITGWNCYGYPDSLENACWLDTTVVYISPSVAGLQATLTAPDTIEACDTLLFDVEIKATGAGDVNHIEVLLETPVGCELSYVNNSGEVTFLTNSTTLNPSTGSGSYLWEMDSVSFLATGFDGADPAAHLTFMLLTGCSACADSLQITVTGANYCGALLGPIVFNPTIVVLPATAAATDSFTLSTNTPVLRGCGDQVPVNITLVNQGSAPTGSGNTVTLTLPAGIVWSGGTVPTSSVGNTYTFAVPAGIAPGSPWTLSFNITSTAYASPPCGNYPVTVEVAGTAVYMCNEVECETTTTLVSGPMTIQVRRPSLVLSDADASALCNYPAGYLTVQIDNPSAYGAINQTLSWYCVEPGANYGCLLATGLVTVPAGNAIVSALPVTNPCGGCTQVIAVVSGCICAPDTIADTVNCEPCDIRIECPRDVYVEECEKCEVQIRDIGWPKVWGPCSEGAIITNDAPAGGIYPMGTTTVTWTIIDNQGNVHYCTQLVTVTMGYDINLISESWDDHGCVTLKFEMECPEIKCDIKYIAFNVKCWKVDEHTLYNNYGLPMYVANPDPVTGWTAVVIDGLWDFCDHEHAFGNLQFSWTMCPEDDCKPELDYAIIGNPCIEYGTIPLHMHKTGFVPDLNASLKLSPNPTNGAVTLEVGTLTQGMVKLEVTDLRGHRLALLHEGDLPKGIYEWVWNENLTWPSGTYLVHLTTGNGMLTRRLVIQR